jgi:cytochrome c biogenesis protein CcdA
MVDYYAVMNRALAKLDRNTAEERRVLFDGARAVLLNQLRNRKPPASEPEVKREQFALEVAIRKVELELATAVVRSSDSTNPQKSERPFGIHPIVEAQLRERTAMSVGKTKPELFSPADPADFLQITTHMWLDHLMSDANSLTAREGLKKDAATVLKWLGVRGPEDVGSEQHEQWTRGFKQYLLEGKAPSAALMRSFNFFRAQLLRINKKDPYDVGESITADMRAVYDRMLADDEEIADFRSAHDLALTAELQSEQSADNSRGERQPLKLTPEVRRSSLGFVLGFALIFVLEALLFGGIDLLSAHRPRLIGLGWLIMPVAAGFVGRRVFRKGDFPKIANIIERAKMLFAEIRSWPREHQLALAIVFAIGWLVATVLGFLVSVTGTPDFSPRRFGIWLLGSSEYFPWSSLLSGLTGGIVGAALIWVRQLLRSGDARITEKT